MSESESSSEQVFDVDRVRALVDLMKQHDLNEIDLQHAERRIRLRRGSTAPPTYYAAPPAPAPHPGYAPPAAAPAQAAPPAGAPVSTAAADDANAVFIKSPMVGTFYSKPNPKAQPYVKPGDRVSPDTVVCQIEAMKTFSEIPAGVSGVVAAVLVNDEDPVDVDKPLFRLE